MDNNIPSIEQTQQGNTVLYKQKFLYSKYNPEKTINQTINQINIQPNSLILCCSAPLSYGIKELKNKLPKECFILGIEFDTALRNFSKTNNKELYFLNDYELYNLPSLLNLNEYKLENQEILPNASKIKRIIRIDFSAGTSFNKVLYDQLEQSCTQSLMTFWSNRMTLTKFGRRYSQNFFKNLKILNSTTPIQNYFNSISKPIIVFGAGQSNDTILKQLKSNAKDFFILCVDTAIKSLLNNKIKPDGIFIEEAQSIIAKAFIGTFNKDIQIFAGLSSLPQINHNFNHKNISFFTTLYTNAKFITELQNKNLLPPCNNPFGSVGLTAVYYALKFRKDDSVNIYLSGLDFSYSSGITHCKDSMAHIIRLLNTNRITPIQNYNACFNNTTFLIPEEKTKSKTKFYTTPTLQNYANLFNGIFENTKNLYDISNCGINLNIQKMDISKIFTESIKKENFIKNNSFSNDINSFFIQETNVLQKIKDVLTGKIKMDDNQRKEYLINNLKCREYLYLHFADGYKFEYSQSFLNRIRTEIDFFLKIF